MKAFFCFILFLPAFLSLKAQGDSLSVTKDRSIQSAKPVPDSFTIVGKPITGAASVFSSKDDGNKTASGELFSNAELTGACNRFPFNTWVRVTNLANNRVVLVRINDRTSRKKNAPVMMLSRSAVLVLGFLKTGKAKVKIEQISVNNYKSDISDKNDTILKKQVSVKPIPSKKVDLDSFTVKGKPVTGIASFYSANLDGTKTATGERFQNSKLTAASNHFKLNTWVRVTNIRNGKTVIVKINDRMHPKMKKRGRVVDLSRSAAKQLDFMDNGLVKVKVQAIEWMKSKPVSVNEVDSTQLDTLPKPLLPAIDTVIMADSARIDSVKPENGAIYGIASFYSKSLDGTKTATGERYRNNVLSAASNDFALNTWVRITNLKNNKSLILRINDRMHPRMQQKGRVVDLSRIAAKKLDFIKSGLVKVKVEPVQKGIFE